MGVESSEKGVDREWEIGRGDSREWVVKKTGRRKWRKRSGENEIQRVWSRKMEVRCKKWAIGRHECGK